jgi:hypothetical protein
MRHRVAHGRDCRQIRSSTVKLQDTADATHDLGYIREWDRRHTAVLALVILEQLDALP